MKFAKIVFWIAGVYGVLVLTPVYFTYNLIGRLDPPPLTHPQFYFGFLGVTMAWQFVFFVIGTNPSRFRPIMILALVEKLSYVLAVVVLYLQHRMTPFQSLTAVPDTMLGFLFIFAFFKTRRSDGWQLNQRQPTI
jgi:hypothetical protein